MAKNSERAHNRAKHNVGTWSRPKDMTAAQDDAQTAWRRDYFRNVRPDLDPQSTASKIMEFFGADTPYAQNVQSYDYRQKAWDDSVKSGSPDLSWVAPGLTDYGADTMRWAGSGVIGGDAPESFDQKAAEVFQEINDREPSPEELQEVVRLFHEDIAKKDTYRRDFVANSVKNGMSEEDANNQFSRDWSYLHPNDSTLNERNAGAILNGIDLLPLPGFADEAMAGAMSLIPGRGSYQDELALAESLHKKYDENEAGLTLRNLASNGGGVAAGFLSPVVTLPFKGAQMAWGAGRKLLGLAPEATGAIGKAAGTVVPGAVGGAADFALYDMGVAEGDIANRIGSIDPEHVKSGALVGGVIGPAAFSAPGVIKNVAVGGVKSAYNQSKRIGQAVAKRMAARGEQASARAPHDAPTPKPDLKPKPRAVPQEPGDGSLRGAIKEAFRRRRK